MQDIKTFGDMVRKLVLLLTGKQRRGAIVVLFFIIISALLETLSVSAILPFIQSLMSPEEMVRKPYIKIVADIFGLTTVHQITVVCGGVIILIYITKNVVILISNYVKAKYSTGLIRDLSILIMSSFLNRPYIYFVNHNTSEIMQGVNGDTGSVNDILNALMQLTSEGMTVFLLGVYLFVTDPILAIGVVLVGCIVALLVIICLKGRLSKMGIISREANMQTNRVIIQISQGIKDIFVMQRRKNFLDKFSVEKNKLRKATMNKILADGLPERLIEASCVSGIIIVVIIRYSIGINVETFVPNLAVFAMAAFRMLPSVSRMSGYISSMVYARPGLEAAYVNILEARIFMESVENCIEKKDIKKVDEFKNYITMNDISWKYGDGQKNILKHLNMEIFEGESIGIIGESGAGKSTLSDILLGLYIPQEGTVMMDEHSIFDIPMAWSKIMGYVPQVVFLMDDTIKNNIAFGDNDIDEKRVWDALEQARMKDYVSKLPQGLETVVGERGIKFSGGQRQRLAIARALYSKPSILILDEATSALDNDTEEAVMEAIEHLQGRITMIIIAHRLTTLKNCDHIYEIIDGHTVERSKKEIGIK